MRQTQTVDLQTADVQACGLADMFGTHGEGGGGGGGGGGGAWQGFRPEGEIPRRHSSNSRVY